VRFVKGRCRASNLCDYCAVLASVEAAEMLALDGMTNAPTLLVVLTTRTATVDVSGFELGRQHLARAIRRERPGFQYASLVEWTTGYGARSGGLRRPHWNWLCKGLAGDDDQELVRELVARHWCREVDAEPYSQHVGPVYSVGGLTRYLAMHFLKESQAPPPGFRGQRFNATRGYFDPLTRAEARGAAQASLREKRRLRKALDLAGEDAPHAELVELILGHLREVEDATTWDLVEARRLPGGVLVAREMGA
jgi:hypothetical protein